ncbi:MAG: hypothetical protein JXD18_12880 [Anaerolineae bacterium]|nr:hypothetical protein [Anaerolineae bacterium]
MAEKEQPKERKMGRYVVQEWTARRLVMDMRRRPLATVGIMWAMFVPVAVLVAPWMGGGRLFVAATAAVTLLFISAMTVAFIPLRRRIAVDLEEGAFKIASDYFPRRTRTVVVPIQAVKTLRRRRRVWQTPGEVKTVEWVVDLVGVEGETWLLCAGEDEEATAELARLLSDVANRPLEGPQ